MITLIKTTASQPTSARATVIGTKTRYPVVSYTYEGLKIASKTYGFYQDIKPYLPETYLDKYRYKPHKRVAGYLGKAVWNSKASAGNNKFRKTRSRFSEYNINHHNCGPLSKSSYCSKQHSRYWLPSWWSYQSNLGFNRLLWISSNRRITTHDLLLD